MWTEQSNPIITLSGVVKPIIADKPVLDQPPKFVKTSKASCALSRGAMTQRGIMMAAHPAKCRIRTAPSTKGSCGAKNVLKAMENTMAAMDRRVPWYACHT